MNTEDPSRPAPTTRYTWPILEAALVLGVSPSTIRRMVRAGKLATVKIGRRTYITDDELRRYVASLQRTAYRADLTDDWAS